MATKVVMEALSPTMEEGRLVKWLKKEGDSVKSGEPLAEVETDKAVMELVARTDGVLRKQVLAEGTPAPVGQLVGVIAGADENIDALVAGAGGGAPAGAAAPAARPAEQVVAKAQESAGASSVPRTPAQSQGEASMPPQQKAAGAPPQSPGPGAQATAPDASEANGGRIRSSPLARRLASERGVDLGAMQGSGPGGRIVKRDIEGVVAGGGQAAARAATPVRPRSDADFEDAPLTQIRKTIARRLSESIGPIPTFYLTAEIDLSRASELRDAMLETGEEYKVSFNDIVLKAVATALSQHPEVNAHWLGDKIRYHNRVHLGMAVATDDGLIVPVIFDADQKRMSEISAEAKSLARRARERKLKPEEYTGSTFSVSNLGMFGIDQFTAIINPPEVAILAIGAVEEKPIVVDDDIVVQKRMRITMSCDHRVVDGAVGAKFMQTLRRMLENPLMLVF
ncbi:MAG TPA: dihydrolipoamide acetyltransferase family protein [Gemmatimonadaceae bacterium]|nr:dihydrolipoamide acetyltransferase family protein [Gemmatimonadaceae bacterium]